MVEKSPLLNPDKKYRIQEFIAMESEELRW